MAESASMWATHFVNPHGIWLQDTSDNARQEQEELSRQITEYVRKNSVRAMHVFKPSVGEIVGYCPPTRSLWLRGVIDEVYERVDGTRAYLVWLLDHGVHVEKVSNLDNLASLGSLFDQPARKLYKVGLFGLIPAKSVPDILFTKMETKPSTEWVPSATKLLHDTVMESINLTYFPVHLHTFDTGETQSFGRITVSFQDAPDRDLGDILVEHSRAIYDEEAFKNYLKELKPINRKDRVVELDLSLPSQPVLPKANPEDLYQWTSMWTNEAANAVRLNLCIDPYTD